MATATREQTWWEPCSDTGTYSYRYFPNSTCGCRTCVRVRKAKTNNPVPGYHRHEITDMGYVIYNTEVCYCANEVHWKGESKDGKALWVEHYSYCRCKECVARRRKTPVFDGGLGKSKAAAKARSLFRDHLTRRQKFTEANYGYVDVLSPDGQKWRIDCFGLSGNLLLLRNDGRWFGWCIVPQRWDEIPKYDFYLSELLMLKTNPGKAKRTAYSTGFSEATGVLRKEWKDPGVK